MSPKLTAEELTNQVLEMRGTAAGTDLWVTFEILEHGELGEYDRVCACACVVWYVWGSKSPMTSVLPNTVDTVPMHVRGQSAQLATLSFSILSPLLVFVDLLVSLPPQRRLLSFAQIPNVERTQH